jgi:heme oxygenase
MAAQKSDPAVHGRSRPDAGTYEDLPARLRRETAALHARVEAATGLPGSVRDRDDYGTLLRRLHGFHAAVETRLADQRWARDWAGLGLDLADYRRTHLLEEDLAAMQGFPVPVPSEPPSDPLAHGTGSFAGALGCLYVTEGSALGGRVLGPAIRAAVAGVPTRFFDSAGRGHPSPWRTLVAALRRFGDGGGDQGAVVAGARSTFQSFELRVASPNAALVR